MDIFDAPRLISMLDNSSKQPRERMLNLFNLLDKGAYLAEIDAQTKLPTQLTLIEYLTVQATQLGAASPSMLAEHIVLIARSAAMQATKEPAVDHLAHAKKAAEALILAQTQKESRRPSKSQFALYGMAASAIMLLGLSAFWLASLLGKPPVEVAKNSTNAAVATTTAPKDDSNKLTAQDAVAMYAQFDQMRTGTCQFPEAIQIPDQDKAVYLENVVGGKLPTNLTDLATANKYLVKVRCNYTPMLMAKSK